MRNTELVPLEPKVFATLLVLLRHGGQLVGKEDLMHAVWPDTLGYRFIGEIRSSAGERTELMHSKGWHRHRRGA